MLILNPLGTFTFFKFQQSLSLLTCQNMRILANSLSLTLKWDLYRQHPTSMAAIDYLALFILLGKNSLEAIKRNCENISILLFDSFSKTSAPVLSGSNCEQTSIFCVQ